jgi:RNA polymerase sigma-70 factor (ECF subfamily)
MSESAVKVALHRMRRRFGELLRKEVARTVNDPAEGDEEIRYLFDGLGRYL